MRTVIYNYKKITYPDADAPLFGKQLFVKVEPDYTNLESIVPFDGTDDEITVKVDDDVVGVYHSKWLGGVCYFYFDVKSISDFGVGLPINYLKIVYEGVELEQSILRLGSWTGERVQRNFNGTTLFKAGNKSSFKLNEDYFAYIKLQSTSGISIKPLFSVGISDAIFSINVENYDLYYYCFTDSPTPPEADYEGWLGGYELKSICSTLGIEPQKSKFYWVDRYGFVHTYYFEVTGITNGKGDKVEYAKTATDANDNVSYYKTSISQPKITKSFQSEDEDLKNIKDIATLGSAMYLEINGIPTDPSLISALTVPNEKGLSRLTFSVDFITENKNVFLW